MHEAGSHSLVSKQSHTYGWPQWKIPGSSCLDKTTVVYPDHCSLIVSSAAASHTYLTIETEEEHHLLICDVTVHPICRGHAYFVLFTLAYTFLFLFTLSDICLSFSLLLYMPISFSLLLYMPLYFCLLLYNSDSWQPIVFIQPGV